MASTARFPFPQQVAYGFGIKPASQSQATMNNDCQRIYQAFLKFNVTNSGCPPSGYRVHCGPALSYQTLSEGIAWGMLMSVFMDNATNNTRPFFDGFNLYRKAYANTNGFMYWRINADGTVAGTGPAIEADQNMALALLLAHYQWGSTTGTNYHNEAMGLLSSLMTYCVVKPQYAMKPGDTWGGLSLLHPCAWNVGYYPLFAKFTGNAQWTSVLNTHLSLINIFYTNYITGLMPHWCQFDGSPTGNADPYFADYTYEYDACQTPWKYNLFYLWNGTNGSALPYAHCKRLAGWINTQTGGNPNSILDNYNLDGTLTTNAKWNATCFVGTFGVAAMSDPIHQAWLNTLYDNLRQRNPTSGDYYYNTLIQMMSLLVMSGNFPNLMALAEGQSQTGRTTIVWNDLRQQIDGFGASSAWRSSWTASQADKFFSTNGGIGLSLLRSRIAPDGTTVETNIMRMAQARGARIWSTPWSPPANMKNTGSVKGGNFIGGAATNQAYANQLAGYVAAMSNVYGVTIHAISVQNEPDYTTTNYESCAWTAQQIHDFVPYLATALAVSNVASTRIMLPESMGWTSNTNLYTTAMNDPAVASNVSIIANHNYVDSGGTPGPLPSYGKPTWETEVSNLSEPFDGSFLDGLYWGGRIHQFMTAAEAAAWHYWWLIPGTTNSGNQALTDTQGVPAKRMYVLGNFSRFVRPGYYRIGSTNNTGPLQISAYKNITNGAFAIVAINPTATNVSQTFTLNGFTVPSSVTPWLTSALVSLEAQAAVPVAGGVFTNLIPAQSVVTFVGTGFESTNALLIQNGPAPTGADLGATQALVSATVVTTGGPAATGYLFYGETDAGTNLTWAFTNLLGTLPPSAVVTSTIVGLKPGTAYYFMCYATNTAGQARWGGTTGVPFTTAEHPWANGSKMKITLAGYTNRTEALLNFPVLVAFSNNVGGSGFSFAHTPFATATGCDLRFVTNAADTGYSLNYEIDTWNTNSTCYVWVQVPRLPGDGSGAIWAEWGDPAVTNRLPCTTNGATWDATAFAGVWHLTPALIDSTANRNHGTDNSTMDTNGVIGRCRYFANSPAKYISISDTNDTLDMPSDMTISLWVYPTILNSWQNELVTKQPSGSAATDAPGNYEYRIDITNSASLAHQTDYTGGKRYNAANRYNAVQSNSWQYLSVVLSAGSRCYHYINGAPLTNISDSTAYGITNDNPVLLGRRANGTGFNGGMDEVRIERVARSSNWVWACYQTMAFNTEFSGYEMLTTPPLTPSGYSAWAAAITNGLTNATDCAAEDGYPNLLKYATGSSPTTSDDLARLSVATDSNGVELLFNSNTNANDVSITAEGCYRLIAPDWAGIASNIHGAGWRPTNCLTQWGLGVTNPVSIRILDPGTGATSRFFRLRVTQP